MNKQFPATKDHLHAMVEFIKNGAEEIGFTSKELNRIELAAEETIINIISYAYPDKKGVIFIGCSETTNNKGIKIIITDIGIPFNPLKKGPNVNIDAPLEERTYGGYGVFLINKVMDHLDYQRSNNKNILTLIKYTSNE